MTLISAGQFRQIDLAAAEIGGPSEDPRTLPSGEFRVPVLSYLLSHVAFDYGLLERVSL